MSFKKTETTLSADVAQNGTFTIAYPAGTQAGSFAGTWAHKLWAAGLQYMLSNPNDFTLSFGASSITVTYKGATTLPSGTRVNLQLDVLGTDDGNPARVKLNAQARRASVNVLDLGSPITADADGVAASQSVSAGASFVINGALAGAGKVVFDTPRNVVAAWTTASVLTITGTDVDGNAVVEKSASGTSHTGKKAFKTVTSVSSSIAITGATVGSGVILGLPAYLPDASYIIAELKNGVRLPRAPGVVYVQGQITEAEGDAGTSVYCVSPVAGVIKKLTVVADTAVTTGGTISAKIATVAVAGLAVVVPNSGAAGDSQSDTPTLGDASTVVAVGTVIEIVGDAAMNASSDFRFIMEISPTAAGSVDGTLVAGVTSAATATTGDTRGTYSPSVAPDGTAGYQLVAIMPDPGSIGVAQYTG